MAPASLFFIALIPSEPLKSALTGLKLGFAETYNCYHALKSPPHITLIPPFRLENEKSELTERILREVCNQTDAFNLIFDGFGCFKPGVIFVRPVESPFLVSFQNQLMNKWRNALGNITKEDGRPFHPHLTVAFKDLKPTMFRKAWEEYSTRSFIAEMTVNGLWLLKHDGKIWWEFKYFQFRGA